MRIIRAAGQAAPLDPARPRVIPRRSMAHGMLEADFAVYAYLRQCAAEGLPAPSKKALARRWHRTAAWAWLALERLAARGLIEKRAGDAWAIPADGTMTPPRAGYRAPLARGVHPLQDQILAVFADRAAERGGKPVALTYLYLMRELRRSATTITKAVERLERRGDLRVIKNGGRAYRIIRVAQAESSRGREVPPSVAGTLAEIDFLKAENARLRRRLSEREGARRYAERQRQRRNAGRS